MDVDRRVRKKERTRQALLDVAIRLIAERGIHGTRVEDITERIDLGKGAFYNYFESKDRLIAELVSRGVELLHRDYLRELSPSASTAERIAAIVAAHEAFFSDHPVYVVLFHQARGLATMHAEHAVLAEVFVDYLSRAGNAIAPIGSPDRPDDATLNELAAVILGSIAGYRSFRLAAGLGFESRIVASILSAGMPSVLTKS